MWLVYIIIGLIAGVASGFFGIGGGSILIPALVYLLSCNQHQAQGTSLAAMLPPVFLLAFWKYYSAGNVKIQMAIFISLGVLLGGFFGAIFAHKIADPYLKKLFGFYLLLLSLKMVFGK
ncbi:MAG: sulfite exporter TauE/SafE family protein [Candidatus Omnitrophica bacterium]|jgi:uncharacterized membrane protein YfcA|nr:sulfite exporter TauE/SafE family protein [Candidatus Omnitrophota bacterium]